MSMRTGETPNQTSRVNVLAIFLALVLGAVLAGAEVIAGNPVTAIAALAIIWGFAGLLWFGSRYSDTIALIGDDVNDERHVHIHQRAALYTINLLGLVVVAAFIVDIARGGTGSPYTYMALIGAVTYFSFLLVLSRRT